MDDPASTSAGAQRLSERELRGLLDVGRALVAELDVETVLRRVLDTALELTDARYAALGIIDESGEELKRFLFTGLDEETRRQIGDLPRGRGVLGELIRHPVPLRLPDVSAHPRSYGFPPGHPPMKTFLGVPLAIRNEAFGNLYLADKADAAEFSETDEELVLVLAQWAAIAIDNAQNVEADRVRSTLQGAEQERKRWARELHDETLQELGAVKLLLETARLADTREGLAAAAGGAIEQLDLTIRGLQGLIAELRPAALDELGVEPAIRALLERTAVTSGLDIEARIELTGEGKRLDPELGTTVYRLVQEAVTNATKHARAEHVRVEVMEDDSRVAVTVTDDGEGFRRAGVTRGYGLLGMEERVDLAGGTLRIESAPGSGTRVRAELPARHVEAPPASGGSPA